MRCCAAIGIDNDFASGYSGITQRTASNKTSSWVDKNASSVINQLSRYNFVDDQINNLSADFFLADFRRMLGGDDDGIYTFWLTLFIFYRYLALRIRTCPINFATLAEFSQFEH